MRDREVRERGERERGGERGRRERGRRKREEIGRRERESGGQSVDRVELTMYDLFVGDTKTHTLMYV